MRRLTQTLIAGGLVAAAAGLLMGRNNNGMRMSGKNINRWMNSTINMMANLGIFHAFGRSRFLKNMVKMR